MPDIEVNGVTLYYEEKGTGEPPIVFIPGFGGSARTSLLTLPALSEHNRFIAIDIRGHGQSAGVTQGWTLSQLADDVFHIIRKLGLSRVVCMGGSMGGAIAMRLALDHPDAVDRLVLISSMPACGSTTPREIIENALTLAGSRENSMKMTLSLFVRPISREIEARLDDFSLDTLLVDDAVRRTWLLEEAYFNWEADLDRIRMPVLVIYGDKDFICNAEAQHRMARLLPGAKEIVVPDTGHMMVYEAEDTVTEEILAFLGE